MNKSEEKNENNIQQSEKVHKERFWKKKRKESLLVFFRFQVQSMSFANKRGFVSLQSQQLAGRKWQCCVSTSTPHARCLLPTTQPVRNHFRCIFIIYLIKAEAEQWALADRRPPCIAAFPISTFVEANGGEKRKGFLLRQAKKEGRGVWG